MAVPLSSATRKHPRRRAPTLAEASLRANEAFDRDFWLAHSHGFRVDGNGGRIGIVEEIREGHGENAEPLLVVRAGLLGRRLLLFPASEAAFIVPQAKRIWLRSTATIVGSEPAAVQPVFD